MAAVQETCARIGIVTGNGLAAAIDRKYGKKILLSLTLLLLIANTINIGADIGAMTSSAQLLIPSMNYYFGVIIVTLFMLFLVINFAYHQYAKILKWLTLSLFAYIITAFIVHPNWGEVAKSVVIPQLHFNLTYFTAIVAFLGTTISPYLFFWQTSQEVEEKIDKDTLSEHHELAVRGEIKEMRRDTYAGMFYSNFVALFIVITTAVVLFSHGINNINSAAEAALALKPLAGNLAYLLFTVGIIGIGLLAVPVLAGASAYAMAEVFNWNEGLKSRYRGAKGFYDVIIFSMVIGMLMNFVGINPIKGLYYAAVINGIVAPILMYFIFRVGSDKKIMGKFRTPRTIGCFGWLATVIMALCAIILITLIITGIH
jgi:Mn2+/Fe2+ NRAMP family transporter